MDMTDIVTDAIIASLRTNTTTHIRPSSLDEYTERYNALLAECIDYSDDDDFSTFWGEDLQVRLYPEPKH
jgi:hypothetical protein